MLVYDMIRQQAEKKTVVAISHSLRIAVSGDFICAIYRVNEIDPSSTDERGQGGGLE